MSTHIYRSDTDQGWILEVKDHLNGSTVRDDEFASDKEALDASMSAEEDGSEAFALAAGS